MELGKSSKITSAVNGLGDGIVTLNRKIEKIPGRYPEIIAAALYAVLHIVISLFHEPWYDEAVSWNIARSASIKEILFVLPHYEGHPPLWHLILVPFAKLGCPYELSLMLVSLFFSGSAVMLLLWKSPFPRTVRLLLPFTYFIFYQFGVISRPYCVMMLAFFLAALTFKKKDEKPWQFILSLMLLCLSSAYGIIFAGGITVAWLIGLLKKEKLRFLANAKRTISLACLLALAILLILEISSAEDAFAVTTWSTNSAFDTVSDVVQYYILSLAYTFIVLPADLCATNIFCLDTRLSGISFATSSFLPALFIGLIIWAIIVYFAKQKGTLLTLLIPYSLFALFSTFIYMSLHHSGIPIFLFVFWAWVTCGSDKPLESKRGAEVRRIAFSVIRLVGTIFLIVPLCWTVFASIHEIIWSSSIAKKEAEFILDNHLDNYRIMVGHQCGLHLDENGEIIPEKTEIDFNHTHYADNVMPYLDRNIFFNFNEGADDMTYTLHKTADENDFADLIEKWRAEGAPDVLFNPLITYLYSDGTGLTVRQISTVYSGITDISDYTMVYFSKKEQIWKASYTDRACAIYVRTDLAEELGLEKVSAY